MLTEPALDILIDLIKSSKNQFYISPFVKDDITQLIFENSPKHAKISLLTSYKLSSFYRKASDIEAIKRFICNDSEVRNYHRLHSKAYIFDNRKAIITSANLTSRGFRNNYECGVLLNEESIVNELYDKLAMIFFDKENAPLVTESIIETTEQIISQVPKHKREKFEKNEKDIFAHSIDEHLADVYDGGAESIEKTLSGWRGDVFKVVCQIQESIFTLEQVYLFFFRKPLENADLGKLKFSSAQIYNF